MSITKATVTSRGIIITSSSLLSLAVGQSFADTDQLKMHKSFSPPPIIKPLDSLSARPDNQFYQATHLTEGVTKSVDDSISRPLHFSIGAYGQSNMGVMLFKKKEAKYYMIFNAQHSDADRYKDGDGKKVNYGYRRETGALIFGLTPSAMSEYKFAFINDRILNDKQPQHRFDPKDTRRNVIDISSRLGAADQSNTFNLRFYNINFDRRGSNYDLRSNNSPKKMKVPVKKDIYGAVADYRFTTGNLKQTIGIKYKQDSHDAIRYLHSVKDFINAYRFPDIETKKFSVFSDSTFKLNEQSSLKLGLNLDHQNANPRAANHLSNQPTAPAISPAMLWKRYYGVNDYTPSDTELSAKLKLNHNFSENISSYAEIGRLARLPNNIERFHALPGENGAGWIGNPELSPEIHRRIEVGLNAKGAGYKAYQRSKAGEFSQSWQLGASAYYDDVNDFITFDRARGQDGVNVADGSTIVRNVDAKLYGFALSAQYNFSQNFSTKLLANVNYGKNTSDDRNLYQVAPFELNAFLDYQDYFKYGSWNVGMRVRHVASQNNRDDSVKTGWGVDSEKASDGFTTLDLYGGIQSKDRMGVSFGIDNIFDETYAEYLYGNHAANSNPIDVNAPGRTYWLRFNYNF